MAKNADKVMEFVQKELQKDPDVATSDLYEKAKKVDSGVGKLSLRQFNARFPLQVKRQKGAGTRRRRRKKGAPRRKAAPGRGRHGVRDVFLRLAEDLTGAEERKDFVRVLAGVDRYVDDAMKAAGKG